jgi:hypothetical protein
MKLLIVYFDLFFVFRFYNYCIVCDILNINFCYKLKRCGLFLGTSEYLYFFFFFLGGGGCEESTGNQNCAGNREQKICESEIPCKKLCSVIFVYALKSQEQTRNSEWKSEPTFLLHALSVFQILSS